MPLPGPMRVALVLIYPCGKAWKNPPFPSRFIVADRSSPSRVRFAASRPGLLRADPKDALLTRGKGGCRSLRKAHDVQGLGTEDGKPGEGEDPFYVLLEDDRFITHLSVTSDMLLDPLESVADKDPQARLVITVSVRPYDVNSSNLDFA